MHTAQNLNISLIGVPMQWGANRPGVELGPSALRKSRIQPKLESLGYNVRDLGDILVNQELGPASSLEKLKHLEEVVRVNEELAQIVNREIKQGQLPLILGGDHSIAIGSIKGVLNHANKLGLIWLDAHADVNTEETTISGNIHGMPLATLLGFGHSRLTSIAGANTKLDPSKVVIIGARSVDPGERAFLKELDIRVFTMHDIDRHGMKAVMDEALERVTKGTDGVHLSLDMDSMDPHEAPGVGTPVNGGLSYRESHFAMELLAESGALLSADVVEVNPSLDQNNKTARMAVELVGSAFGESIL